MKWHNTTIRSIGFPVCPDRLGLRLDTWERLGDAQRRSAAT